jgi:hypothetical protein
MSLSYGGSVRSIEARRVFSRKSVPQLRIKFEALGFKMASDPTMMTNRAPSVENLNLMRMKYKRVWEREEDNGG